MVGSPLKLISGSSLVPKRVSTLMLSDSLPDNPLTAKAIGYQNGFSK